MKKRGFWKGKHLSEEIKRKISLTKKGISKPYVSSTHDMPRYEWRILRRIIIQRDGEICKNCNKISTPSVADHIVPYRISRDNSQENLQILCRSCHAKKDMEFGK